MAWCWRKTSCSRPRTAFGEASASTSAAIPEEETCRCSAPSPRSFSIRFIRRAIPVRPDLAILKLANPLPDRFVPAVLNPRSPGVGDDLIVAGYGKGAIGDSGASIVLRMVLQRVSNQLGGWVILTSVGEDASGAGPGDSGGPVFAYRGMHSLVGLMVGVSGKRTKAVALATHYNWIKETMQKLSAP